MSRFSAFLIAVLIPIQLFSLENKFEYITVDDGLSQGNIEYIYQDKRGFIWFATFNGLNRYDGYDITVFNHEADNPNSISHEHITQMCEDNGGDIWLATYGGGVTIFNSILNKFTRLEYTIIDGDTITFRQITSIAKGPGGHIWFADMEQGIFVYNTDLEMVQYFINDPGDPNSIPASNYFGIVFDKEGAAWLGIGNGTLGMVRPKSEKIELHTFESRRAAADDGIKSMYIDSEGIIWIGTTSQGAYKFNPKNNLFINYRKESEEYHILANTVMAFAESPDGDILIGVDGGGINIVDHSSGKISTITYDLGNAESLNTNAVYALLYDNANNLWVGTYSAGVDFQSRYKNKFKKYVPDPLNKNSLSYKNVTAFLQDNTGMIWIGTDGGGLNKFDMATDSFTHYRADPTNPNWLQTDVIIHLMQDRDGDIYISSYNHGLTLFNPQEMTWKQYLPDDSNPNSIAGIHPWYCYQDSYGVIWVGMLAVGLDKFDKETETFTHYTQDVNDPTKLNSPNIKIIYEDMERELWIGTEGGGLHRYNREEDNFTRFIPDENDPTSISNGDIRAIYEDMQMRFWVGTNNGLNLMDRDSGTFKVITMADGLPGNTIDGILEDNQGNLWISTDAGISKFNPDSMTFRNYDKTDGLQGNEFNYTASIVSNNGYFFFGGKNGFNMFFPSDIQDNPHKPDVVITNISILNKPYQSLTVKEGRKKITKSVTAIKSLTFSHKQNILTFEFAALDYGNSVKNQYKYMLEGFDKDWTNTDASKRFATYTNLPGGDYVFRVRASNGDGVWNEEGLSLEITIKPPFWKRLWFIALLVILAIWLITRYIRNREKKLHADKEILERKIQEGLEEVNKQKEEVAQKDRELQQKLESEEEQNWYNIGMSRMSSVMSQNKDDLHQLSQSIISEIVEYVEVSQGAIYLINDEKEEDQFLELMAAYAPDEERIEGARIEIGEGEIGTCYKEGNVSRIDNLPGDYAKFSSGLGEESLDHLVVIPLKLNEIVIGVVELLSFKSLPDYRVNFVEKSGETLTSILTALKANEKTKKLLEQQRMQAEELSAQEEELRQNLEEMQATQEELARMKEAERVAEEERRAAEREFMEQLKKQNEELNYEKSLIDAFLENSPDHVYFKDKDSKFIKTSHSMVKHFKVKSMEDLVGKSDFDFFDDEHAKPAFEDEQNIIKTGKPILNLVEKEVKKDGSITYVKTSKMPLYDKDGKIIGTFGISADITDIKQMEIEIKQQNEEMQAQEEELRQNLEEMQATQDELIRMREISEERQAALEYEKSLIDAFLANSPDHVYFKDKESRFLKTSHSMVKHFKLKSMEDLIGKSDFDFFDEEHARPAFEDEQNIIKTGKSILNLVEKEIRKDGSITYVKTSKMPLYDKEGKIIGTFGISADITDIKEMEIEIKQQNEEMQAQEEELRQNLEEMQATQDELLRMREISEEKQAALEREQYLFNTLLDSAKEYIYFKDEKSRFIRVSQSMLNMFHAETFKELMGKTDFDFFDEEHARPAFEDEQRIIKTGKAIIDMVEKEVHKDGSVSWVSTSKMPLKDKQGNIVGTFGISKDITEDRKLHEEIKEANKRLEFEKIMFAALMDNIDARITYKDLEARYVRINQTKARGLGLKDPSKIYGKTDPEVFGVSHTKDRLNKEIQQIKKGKASFHAEELLIQQDGQARWGDTSRIPLINQENEIVGGLVITWDITEKKDMEFELEQIKSILDNLSGNLPVIIFSSNAKGTIADIEGKGLDVLKLKGKKAATDNLLKFFPEIKKQMKEAEKSDKNTYSHSGKVTVEKNDISYKYLLVKNKSAQGGVSGYILFDK